MRHCFLVLPLPAGEALFPFAPSPPFSVHSYQSLAHRKYHLPLRPLLLQRLFQLQLLPLPLFFVCGGFFLPLLSYQLLPFQQPLFSAAFFCRLQLSLLPLSYQLQPFQQPLSSQLLLWLFQQLQLPLSFLLQLQLLLPLPLSSSVPQRLPRLFFCASAAALAASASAFFSLRLQPLSSLLLPQL